jgi:hypothetical protein
MFRPSTFFVAAARTWMPGRKAGHDGFRGALLGPKSAEKSLHFLVISPLWG